MTARIVSLLLVLGSAGVALAYDPIRVWYADPNDPNAYIVDQNLRTVTIYLPVTIKVQAVNQDGTLADIDLIIVDPSFPGGTVNVWVVRDPNEVGGDPHQPGAAQVKQIDLAAATVGNIAELRITGDLAADGPVYATGITGEWAVGGDVVQDINIAQDIGYPVAIDGLLKANLTCQTMGNLMVHGVGSSGAIYLYGPAPYAAEIFVDGWMYGSVNLAGPLSGIIRITWCVGEYGSVALNGAGPHTGTIGVAGDLHGLVLIAGAWQGRLNVGGALMDQGTIHISGDVSGTVNIGTTVMPNMGIDVEGALTSPGQILVGLDCYGWIAARSELGAGSEIHIGRDLAGTVDVNVDSFAPAEGNITVGGSLLGSVWAHWGLDAAGTLRVGDVASTGVITLGTEQVVWPPPIDLAGSVLVERDMAGLIKVWHDAGGSIVVGGSLYGLLNPDHGVRILGSLRNPGEVPPPDPTELTGGYIIINGSFGQPPPGTQQGFIHLGDMLGSTTFVTVNYDGIGAENDRDRWREGSTIEIGYTPYTQNTPDCRLWEVKCKADMNNDDLIDFYDIDPFVQALSDPTGYSKAYPGLGGTYWDSYGGGSRVWHGDLNCDGALDFLNIDPFVQRITEGCCQPTCGPCSGGDGPGPTPQQLAAQLAAHIAPQRYGDLVTLAGTAAHALPDPDRRAYWHAVYVALTK